MNPFAHLHVHSDFSQLDGCSRVQEYVEEAERRGDYALAMTEHGSVRSFFELHQQTQGKKVKPIYGAELYLAMDARLKGLSDAEKDVLSRGRDARAAKQEIQRRERELGIQGRFHITIWAKNAVGLSNLFSLSSQAWTSGFYYRPRIDPVSIVDNGEGLIVGSACISSPFYRLMRDGNERKAYELAQYFCDALGTENLVFELMPHPLEEQIEANLFHIQMAKHFGCRCIATQDAHYLRPEDRKHHEVLLAVGTGKTINDLDRFSFEGDGSYHFKTWDEMCSDFEKYHGLGKDWADVLYFNTMEVAERCEVSLSLDRLKGLLPEPELPAGSTPAGHLQLLCVGGWETRGLFERLDAPAMRTYMDRLRYELKVIREKKFEKYFLMVHEMFAWAREHGIMSGPGRGSSAGSIVAYLLGITQVDPIEHGLYFERFINPARVDFPDIDCDFEDRRRGEILSYLVERYGEEKVCRIATFGTLASKQAVKDVARALEVPFGEANRCTAAMFDDMTMQQNFSEIEACSEFAERHPEVLSHAQRLEGFVKNVGIHAAGVVISPVPLVEVVPVETREHKGERVKVTAVDMRAVQELGLVKLDVLGLKALTMLRICLETIRETREEEVVLENIPLDDSDTLAGFSEHDFDCIFQFDTASARKVAGRLRFDHFVDIAAVNAVNRPGLTRSGLAKDYIDRRNNPKLCAKDLFHPKVSELTRETYGVIVYQEQVISILVHVAGFDPSRADIIRKKIGKSAGKDELEKYRAEFVTGVAMTSPEIDPVISHKLMDAMIEFGGYAFNKAHAVAYSMISFWQMWLKRRYPLEFFFGQLMTEDELTEQRKIIRAARRKGINTLPADINSSGAGFSVDAKLGAIRGSLIDIKQVGAGAAEEIASKQPFSSMVDFFTRTERRKVNKRSFSTLLLAGAFDSMIPCAKAFIEGLEQRWALVQKARWADLEALLEDDKEKEDFSPAERVMLAVQVNPLAYGAHALDPYVEFILPRLTEPYLNVEDQDIYSEKQFGYVIGWTTEVKSFYHGSGMFTSKRSASVTCENEHGASFRVFVPWHVLAENRGLFEVTGIPVLFYVRVDVERQSLDARFLVDLSSMKRTFEEVRGKKFTAWERIAFGRHPAGDYEWKTEEHRARVMQDVGGFVSAQPKGSMFLVTGVVTSVSEVQDKKGNLMAFVGLKGFFGFCEVTCFSRAWKRMAKYFAPGKFVSVKVTKERGSLLLDDKGKIWPHD